MFYKACMALAIGIVTLSLIGAFSSANSVSLRQQNYVDSSARRYTRSTYIVPVPAGSNYSGGSGGSSRNNYDGYRGGGPGSGK